MTEPTADLGLASGSVSAAQGPPQPRDKATAKTRALAALWQATWEASQFLTYDEVREFVNGTIAEIESDEP